jgi:dienelactone hydrolase
MRRRAGRWSPMAFVTLTAVGVGLATASLASALDPLVESQNFSKGQERQAVYNTPEYQATLRRISTENEAASLAIQASDSERQFEGHLCARGDDGCAGDTRLYDWQAKGYGIVAPVLWTARNGATISGHVWATKAGPAKRPGIVITNGSVQADEQLYWFVAQTLAKAGYVVLTSDPQGQGQSDEQGESPDQNEGSPAQTDGRPFFDGTEDALNFLVSSPSHPYEPVKSCDSGTSHAAKQDRRVKAGLDARFNPFWHLLDASRIGLAGHSYGAAGVSYIAQWDPRVKAVVAWDNLALPDRSTTIKPCPANPAARSVPPITKPGLGLSGDYGLPPEPNKSDPDPLAKSVTSRAYSKAGVDSGELIIRGGTHLDFDWIPNMGFPATLRGADEINWYTTAWFDRYVKGDPSAERRLVTSRWRGDAEEAAVDPNHDGNMFSFYYRSRLNIGLLGGGRFVCEDMRPGCPGMAADGQPVDYSYVKIDTTRDGPATVATPAGSGIHGCGKRPNTVVHLRRKSERIVRAAIYINGHRVQVSKGRSLKRIEIPAPGPGRHRVKIVLRTASGRTYTSVRTYRGCKKTRPRRMPSSSHRR